MNVSQLSVLYARIHGLGSLVFVSHSLEHPDFHFLLKSMVQFFSEGKVTPYFVRHSKFLSLLADLA